MSSQLYDVTLTDHPVFGRELRILANVASCSITRVDQFIQRHYLHKRPAVTLLCLVASVGNKDIGCVVFSAAPRETSKRYGVETWELARLYMLDDAPKNAETWLIGQAVKYIRRRCSVGCLVSYADPSVGHKGTIYRAANWAYDGMTDEGRKTPRHDYADALTGKKYGRRGHVPPGVEIVRVPRISKLRFVYRLTR